MPSVWISEEEDDNDGVILTGRFSGFFEDGGPEKAETFFGLDLDAALAWGRERADRVYLTTWDQRYEAGVRRLGEYPPWPEGAPAPVRRRVPGEEWRFSYHRGAYRLVFIQSAPTAAPAVERALGRLGELDGWRPEGDA